MLGILSSQISIYTLVKRRWLRAEYKLIAEDEFYDAIALRSGVTYVGATCVPP